MKQPIWEGLDESRLSDVHHQEPLIIQAVEAFWVVSFSLSVYRSVVGEPYTVPQEKNSL